MIAKINIDRQLYLIFVLITFFSISTLSQSIAITEVSDLDLRDDLERYKADKFDADKIALKFQFDNSMWFKKTLFISLNLTDTLNVKTNTFPMDFQQAHASWSYNVNFSNRNNFSRHREHAINDALSYRRIYLNLEDLEMKTNGKPLRVYEGTAIITVVY